MSPIFHQPALSCDDHRSTLYHLVPSHLLSKNNPALVKTVLPVLKRMVEHVKDQTTDLPYEPYTFNAYDSFGDGQTGYSGSGAGADGSIIVTDGNGNELLFITGNWESEVTSNFEVTSGVGIEEDIENTISVFPNPTFNNTSVSLNLVESNQVMIELVNTLGQKVFIKEYEMAAGSNTVDLSVEALNAGIYYLNIIVDDKLMTEKLNILK